MFEYLLLSFLTVSPPAVNDRLAVIKPAPSFELTDQDGKSVRSSELKEEVWLVSFIFTTCSGSCPATTHRMANVHDELKERGILKSGKIRLISITLDPKRDTPDALKRYMQLYELDAKHWSFLTGSPNEVEKVYTSWGMWAKEAANGQLDHPSRIFLVDRKRRIREIYNLAFMKTNWVVADIQLLLNER